MSAVLDKPNEARMQAYRLRAEWLMSLSEGLVSISDVIEAACRPENKALRRLTLYQLLTHQPSWGSTRAQRTLTQLGTLTNNTVSHRRLTLAWLLDHRAGGRRIQAWADVLGGKPGLPWPGFPFASAPSEIHEGNNRK